ncbi:unnamed protein product, partial [Rotaria magnacalcarata]
CNQACSSASSTDIHVDDYASAQKSIAIAASRLTDEQMVRRIKEKNDYY